MKEVPHYDLTALGLSPHEVGILCYALQCKGALKWDQSVSRRNEVHETEFWFLSSLLFIRKICIIPFYSVLLLGLQSKEL